MVNQKGQAQKIMKQAEEEVVKLTIEPPEQIMDPLTELLGRAQRAYADYISAQKEVARAYKEREQQVEKAYKEVEAQANKAWDKAVGQALAIREKAIQQAEETSKKASGKATEVYQENVDHNALMKLWDRFM